MRTTHNGYTTCVRSRPSSSPPGLWLSAQLHPVLFRFRAVPSFVLCLFASAFRARARFTARTAFGSRRLFNPRARPARALHSLRAVPPTRWCKAGTPSASQRWSTATKSACGARISRRRTAARIPTSLTMTTRSPPAQASSSRSTCLLCRHACAAHERTVPCVYASKLHRPAATT